MKYLGFTVVSFVLLALAFMAYRFYSMGLESRKEAPQLGVENGRLAVCPDRPNCVCSYERDDKHQIAPIHGGQGTMALIASHVQSWGGAELMTETENYLHIEVKTAVFGFVDDVEFYFDGSLIQVRSASRVGYSDLKANRKRIERIRKIVSGRY